MKRIIILTLFACSLTALPAQQRKTTKAKAKTTTTAAQRKKSATGKRTATTQKKRTTTTQKKGTANRQPESVQSLQNQRKNIQRQIKQQEARLRTNERNVKKRLQDLMAINTEIDSKRRTIDTIRHDLSGIEQEIRAMNRELDTLQHDLDEYKRRYVKSMRYMHRNRSIQSQMMFIFSASSFSQMWRRLRFMREYASYQRSQGEDVKVKQAEVAAKRSELAGARDAKHRLLARGEQERRSLEGKQTEQQQVVTSLQKEQKTIQRVIAQQRKKDAALNERIDQLIAEEVARQRARAAAEAKRKAEAEAARRREEEARKQREAESAKPSSRRETAKSESKSESKTANKPSKKSESAPFIMDSDDRRISGNFESNRGRLPMPITGSYRIVSHFGQYNVEGLNNVRLDNKGINIQGQPGAQARSIFDGEVSGVFRFGGTIIVMVRHGSYISVYYNLSSVSVRQGQKVTTRQTLGRVGQDNILQFQLRKETAKLNPEAWLR